MEVRLTDSSLNSCINFMQDNINYLPPHERKCIFVVDSKDSIQEELNKMFPDSFIDPRFILKDNGDVKIERYFDFEGKRYKNYISIHHQVGQLYFVASSDIDTINN